MEINTSIIEKILEKDQIFVEFQPVVSVNTRRVVGVEALSRGKFQGETVSPYHLFEYAKELGKTAELDGRCRVHALEAFSAAPAAPMLFLNFEAETLNEFETEGERLLEMTEHYKIPHENIVIEINEKYVNDNNSLLRFVEFYRSYGFLIALDDVGAGYSNLNRITVVRPDVVKVDRTLVKDIDKNSYCKEVFKSIIRLSKKIGAFTVAEGAETVEEVVTCMLCGVDFFQGFYFAKPLSLKELVLLNLDNKMEVAAQGLKKMVRQKQEIELDHKKNYLNVVHGLLGRLQSTTSLEYEDIMWHFVTENNEVECVFLLDMAGMQISDTIILEETLGDRRSVFFAPAVKGDRHEIKNYYYAVKEDIENPFISDWYISNATGKSCKTISSKFQDENGSSLIVCVDIKYDKYRYKYEA